MPQPAKTFAQKLKLQNGPPMLLRRYIDCSHRAPDCFCWFYERARREGCGIDEIDARHNPHITNSRAFADRLDRTAG